MSQMEDDTRRFLKRVVWTIAAGLLWLFINLGLGIYEGWMVPRGSVTIVNIIFYCWLIISLVILLWFFHKIWKEKFPHG